MPIRNLAFQNHPVVKDLAINLINKKTGEPYSIVALVGENGCGKTTILNEIFNYNNSIFIKKEVDQLSVLYLRQGSLHKNATKEVRKLIDGRDMYPVSNVDQASAKVDFNNPEVLKLLQELGDRDIYDIFNENHIGEIYCSQEVSKKIDGKDHGYDIAKYSSGQQEILLKLKDISNMASGVDCVLLDEPETSLHPRWQRKIIDLMRGIISSNNKSVPQIIVATHSEKVLESLMSNEDALIIRLYRVNDVVKTERIDQMDLILPRVTFAELDYVIFRIETLEYCSELFDLLEWKLGVKGDYGVDRTIKESRHYNNDIHYKEWFNDKLNKVTTFTLPVYVRNYFHHPKDRVEPTAQELHLAIELLRAVLKDL